MAGLQAGTIVTWPSNDQEFKPSASLAEVQCCVFQNKIVSIKLKLTDGTTSPLFGTESPNQAWAFSQRNPVTRIQIKHIEGDSLVGLALYSEQLELFNTVAGKTISIGKGVWKWDNVQEGEKIVGIRCVLKHGVLRGLAFSVWKP